MNLEKETILNDIRTNHRKTLRRNAKRKQLLKYFGLGLCIIGLYVCLMGVYGANKSLPEGISVSGETHEADDVRFLTDITYRMDDEPVMEQTIFAYIFNMIDEAEHFIIVDMFLFNDVYDDHGQSFPALSADLTEALLEKQVEHPEIDIVVISDPYNTFYGSDMPTHFQQLNDSGIHFILTDLGALPDSNPIYSSLWRAFFQWFGTPEGGWLPNIFASDAPDMTLRSYLSLLNMKANHRKTVITEKEALVTSANAHDASGHHSNIAFVVEGDIIAELVESERAVASFSGQEWPDMDVHSVIETPSSVAQSEESVHMQLITEGKIREHLVEAIRKATEGDTLWMGMFYLSERSIMNELIDAARRGVNVQLILDPNKDAFGREKGGIPNRPVASELVDRSEGQVAVRWYDTDGEQYHAKLTYIEHGSTSTIIGGSANLTRRNIADFNLETNVQFNASVDHAFMQEVNRYFERLWHNEDGYYTTNFEQYAEESRFKRYQYRFQEWSGLSSF